jgi:uncharacterized membrane protein YeaQ/YmgE (transglycosylase-associated protein family)
VSDAADQPDDRSGRVPPPPAAAQPPAAQLPPYPSPAAAGTPIGVPPAYPDPAGQPVPYASQGPPGARGWEGFAPRRPEIRWALAVALALAVVGFGVAAIWLHLAPRLPFRVIRPGEATPTQPESELFIGDDAWFFISTVLVGLLAGVLAYLPKRARGWLMTVALAVGGTAGALITWRVGQAFAGRPSHEALQHVGATVLYPVVLQAKTALVAEPFAALVVYLVLAGFASHDDLHNPGERQPDHSLVQGGGRGEF